MSGRRRVWHDLVPTLLGILVLLTAEPTAPGQDVSRSLSASFRKAAARAKGTLVSIRQVDGFQPGSYVPVRPGRFGPVTPFPPFDRAPGNEIRPSFSGVVIDPERGWILTVDPDVPALPNLVVLFPDGEERRPTQVSRDPRTGLVLLAVEMKGLRSPRVAWGDPSKLEAGDWLIALGQPGVGDPSMSVGVFSTRRRGGGEELLETDAAITRIGAGGILINLEGEVVGICKAAGRRADGLEGLGHAIPADRARRVADELGQFGRTRRAVLGVTVQPIGPGVAGLRGSSIGVVVSSVGAGTPAAEAGIRAGDRIIAIGQRTVNGVADLQQAVEAIPAGEEVLVSLERQGQRLQVKARLRSFSPPDGSIGPGTDRPTRDPNRIRRSTPEQKPAKPSSPDGPALVPPDS